jgi:hypothetical protein
MTAVVPVTQHIVVARPQYVETLDDKKLVFEQRALAAYPPRL